jgi:hypothetical protein
MQTKEELLTEALRKGNEFARVGWKRIAIAWYYEFFRLKGKQFNFSGSPVLQLVVWGTNMKTKEELIVEAQAALNQCNEYIRAGDRHLADIWAEEHSRLTKAIKTFGKKEDPYANFPYFG